MIKNLISLKDLNYNQSKRCRGRVEASSSEWEAGLKVIFLIRCSTMQQKVIFRDLGIIDYKSAWDYQEELVRQNIEKKRSAINGERVTTVNYFLFCEHPPVYTLGKSGKIDNVLLSEQEMEEKEIEFFRTNRGGDITFHGLQQVVGYPILDLENFYTDIRSEERR